MTNVESMTKEALLYNIKDCLGSLEAWFDNANSERYVQEIQELSSELALRIADDKAHNEYVTREAGKTNSLSFWFSQGWKSDRDSREISATCEKYTK